MKIEHLKIYIQWAKKLLGILATSITAFLGLSTPAQGQSVDEFWTGGTDFTPTNAVSGEWTTRSDVFNWSDTRTSTGNSNWTNGNIAHFLDPTGVTVTLTSDITAAGINFESGAGPFMIHTNGSTLTLQGVGIVNNSGIIQTIVNDNVESDGVVFMGRTIFRNSATASDVTITNSGAGASTEFHNTSSAANATITNSGLLSRIEFFDASSAGNAMLINGSLSGGVLLFHNTSNAANATIVNRGIAEFSDANGFEALFRNTTGFYNTATGAGALQNNTTGILNTADGWEALYSNTNGQDNTAIGESALANNTVDDNTATGSGALLNNTTGIENTANGAFALELNTTGNNNTANGFEALLSNTIGSNNTASGVEALALNTTGTRNMANGAFALQNNTTGNGNMANGFKALFNNTTGSDNTANGINALLLNKTGNGNIAEGDGALENNSGSFNTGVGFNAGANLTTGSNNIDIGALGVAGEANTLRIGTAKQTATFIAGISGATVAGGVGVTIDTRGHLGTVVSSVRFKDAVKPMDKASEAILALKPVTFRYKHELDPDGIPQFGLVAEQVEKVNSDLVARDADGKVNTVRYEAVNAMLLNEFLKEHKKVEELGRRAQEQGVTIAQLKARVAQQQKDFQTTIAQQEKEIRALGAGLEKINHKLELSKSVPQVVARD